ncbi:MAG: CDP-alcohol phosphatidyltransferase family protein [Planctomycetes bacterium]|nr:CDP-alcohol phosphatidyltransferase family protein [Planctomycetota bacterium]
MSGTAPFPTAADLVSLGRPVLALAALLAFREHPFALVVSLAAVLLLDILDGWLARRRASSRHGAFIDLIGDRLVELTVLFTYAAWGWLPWAIGAIFLIRGILTDTIRVQNARYPDPAFAHPLSVGGADSRFWRAAVNGSKIAAFVLVPLGWQAGGLDLGLAAAWLAVAVNLRRGLPVILSRRGRALLRRLVASS